MPQEEQLPAIKLINTTGYTIAVIDNVNGKKLLTLPPTALVLYAHYTLCVESKWRVAGVGVSVYNKKYHLNGGTLPPKKEGVVYIVRPSVFDALRLTRSDLAFMIDYFPPEEDLSDDSVRYTHGFLIESYFDVGVVQK